MRVPPLKMTCSVARGGTADSFGQLGTPSVVATSVKCYWWSGTPSQTSSQGLPGVIATENEHLWVSRATDVRQGDRVHTVIDATGRSIVAVADYRIVEHVVPHRSYLDCFLAYGEGIGGRA